jgi:hypothetical protein
MIWYRECQSKEYVDKHQVLLKIESTLLVYFKPIGNMSQEELSAEEFRKIVFENKLKMHGKTYPIITAQDIIDKEAQMCFYCFLHSSHTPCGKQLQKWKDCTLSRPEKSDKEEEEKDDENDGKPKSSSKRKNVKNFLKKNSFLVMQST